VILRVIGAVESEFFIFEIVNVITLFAVITVGEDGKLLSVRVLLRPGVLVKVAKLELLTEAETIYEGKIITIVS